MTSIIIIGVLILAFMPLMYTIADKEDRFVPHIFTIIGCAIVLFSIFS